MDTDSDSAPFPDGQTVYHQLRWDSRFDAGQCEIVLTDRPAGTKVIAFRDFLPNGPVPWHRIIGFRYQGALLWDRAERIDRRTEVLAAPTGFAPGAVSVEALESFELTVLPALGPAVEALPTSPVIVTWNVLSDAWDGELLDHPARWAALVDEVLARQPDHIVFTECTKAFQALLVTNEEVRSRYTIASSEQCDVMVLSRARPTKSARLEFAPGRQAIVCWFDQLVIAGLHLPSDRDSSRRAERERDLERLSQTLRGSPTLVIAGDFNAQDDELVPVLERLHGLDAWPAANPGDPGLTYDVERNTLAGAFTKRGRSSRLDRIVVFGARFEVRSATLLGLAAPCSDHFGLCATLSPAQSRVTSHRTAVVLCVPSHAIGPIQRLRARFDPRFDRWPPHVSLLYGFVEPAALEQALPRLAEAAARLTAFDVTFDTVTLLGHEATTTVTLTPSKPKELIALQRALLAAFPFCVEQNRGPGGTFTPHLTIARVNRGDERALRELKAALREVTLTWRADALGVLERPDDVFFTRAAVGLGDGVLRRSSALEPTRDDLERVVRSTIDETLETTGLEATIETFGSRAYAPTLEDRDLDLLITVRGSSGLVLDALEPGLPGARRVSGHVLRGDRFDVVAIDEGADDEDSRRFALGVKDARALREALVRHGRAEVFDALLPRVRAWSRRRALEGNAFGYFGGIGWAMLVAHPLLHDAKLCGVGVDQAFAAWARWLGSLERDAVVGLSHQSDSDLDAFTVLSPSAPLRPITRALIPSTRLTFFEEFARLATHEEDERIDVAAWLTVRGPREQVGAWQRRALSIFSIVDRELGPVLRIRGEPAALQKEQFVSRIGLRTAETTRVSRLFVAQLARLELTGVGAFIEQRTRPSSAP